MKKKLLAVLSGILVFFIAIIGFKINMNTSISNNKSGIRNHRTYERYWSSETQNLILDEKTLPIFGSSELVSLSNYNEEVGSFLNGEEMNIVTIGGGNFQSLSHAMSLGAMSKSIKAGKIALFLSPQWFTASGVDATAFAARMSEDNLLHFLSNNKISSENKEYVLNRTMELLSNSPTQLKRVQKYHHALNNKFSIDFLYTKIMTGYWNYRSEFEVYKQLKTVDNNIPSYDLSNIDYNKMLELAEKQGEQRCTNNDFGIYDEYWDTYVKDRFQAGEIMNKVQSYDVSVEYDDLRCFLNVAKELDLEVILVSIPVNAKWYSYAGVLVDNYYQNIRNIAGEYDNIVFVDMSIYENEKYFLKDIMHLGWKGWTRVNEALYKEFIGE